jgi:hypothetical protein
VVEISGFSHFFGFDPRRMVGEIGPQSVKYCRKPQTGPVGMAFAKKPATRPIFKPPVWNSLVLPQKKGDEHRRGQHPCLVQERKAENEECL